MVSVVPAANAHDGISLRSPKFCLATTPHEPLLGFLSCLGTGQSTMIYYYPARRYHSAAAPPPKGGKNVFYVLFCLAKCGWCSAEQEKGQRSRSMAKREPAVVSSRQSWVLGAGQARLAGWAMEERSKHFFRRR